MIDDITVSANLDRKTISEITGRFYIPDYQRGYRWGRKQVIQLLDDIAESKNAYYLQPIVLCKHKDDKYDYDVVDGQQRLTTLYLLYKSLEQIWIKMQAMPFSLLKEEEVKPHYSIEYETRKQSGDYLSAINEKTLSDAVVFPDYLYMYHAFQAASSWFAEHTEMIPVVSKALRERVKIIWYEVTDNVDARDVFKRLNIGKIKLTNSELVKALFLSSSASNIDEKEKDHIVEQWDGIERELHDKKFWAFLTNKDKTQYATRIDLLFDIIANKEDNDPDEYSTFLYFDSLLKGTKNRLDAWNKIYLDFLRLRDWFNDRELYHKIGYLVTVSDSKELSKLLKRAKEDSMTNTSFRASLDRDIKKTVDFSPLYLEDLSYDKNYYEIEKVLTLFNVLSTLQLLEDSQRYPFDNHKAIAGGWSLEHIHAQQSMTLTKAAEWKEWVRLHKKSLERFREMQILAEADQAIIDEIDALLERMSNYPGTEEEFRYINAKFATVVVSGKDDNYSDYKDLMSNMALLGRNDNSVLNNSQFDVKRLIVTTKLISESYVPICTQRVFLKAYTGEDNQLFFWGASDRDAYLKAIESVLKPYLRTYSEQVIHLFKDLKGFNELWPIIKDAIKEHQEEYDLSYFEKLRQGHDEGNVNALKILEETFELKDNHE